MSEDVIRRMQFGTEGAVPRQCSKISRAVTVGGEKVARILAGREQRTPYLNGYILCFALTSAGRECDLGEVMSAVGLRVFGEPFVEGSDGFGLSVAGARILVQGGELEPGWYHVQIKPSLPFENGPAMFAHELAFENLFGDAGHVVSLKSKLPAETDQPMTAKPVTLLVREETYNPFDVRLTTLAREREAEAGLLALGDGSHRFHLLWQGRYPLMLTIVEGMVNGGGADVSIEVRVPQSMHNELVEEAVRDYLTLLLREATEVLPERTDLVTRNLVPYQSMPAVYRLDLGKGRGSSRVQRWQRMEKIASVIRGYERFGGR